MKFNESFILCKQKSSCPLPKIMYKFANFEVSIFIKLFFFNRDIVHRDIKLDNVLIYRSDFQRIKLCDFGESFPTGSTVERRNEWLPYSPPEVLEIKPEGSYK